MPFGGSGHGSNVLNEIAQNPDFAPLRPQVEAALSHWPRWLDLAMALLRRALDNGIERLIPLPEEFKAQIRNADG